MMRIAKYISNFSFVELFLLHEPFLVQLQPTKKTQKKQTLIW